jgi:3-hydroxyisobutyrate dehydrogenase-like beta-hydroxyacid dehydrogenase
MGGRIAQSLIAAGRQAVGFDVSTAACTRAQQMGVMIAGSPAEVAAACHITVACVTGEREAEAVAFGDGGVANAQLPDDVFIDCTTVSVTCARRLAAEFDKMAVRYLDAPLSGGPPNAVAFVGGPIETVAQATSTLTAFAPRICHLGGNGCGALGKLLSQYVTYATFTADAQVLREARRCGLDMRAFVTALRHGSAASMILEGAIAGVFKDERDWGRIRLIQKDLEYLRHYTEDDPTVRVSLLPLVEKFFADVPAQDADRPISHLVISTEAPRGN